MTDDAHDESAEIMAEDADALESSPEEASKGKGPRKKIKMIIVVLLIVLVAALGGVAAFKFLGGKPAETPEEPKASGQASSTPAFEVDPALENMVTLPPFDLPLKDDMGNWELRVTITIEAANGSVKNEIEEKLYKIYDAIAPQLQTRSPTALQGVDAKITLKTELIVIVNRILTRGKIKNLYFTRFYVF